SAYSPSSPSPLVAGKETLPAALYCADDRPICGPDRPRLRRSVAISIRHAEPAIPWDDYRCNGVLAFVGPIPVAHCQRSLPQSSAASRLTAGALGFLLLAQCRERLRHGHSLQGSAAAAAGPAQCRSCQGRLISARPSLRSI